MNNLNVLVTFTIISLAAAFIFFFFPQIISPIPYGTFTFLLVFLITLWAGIRLGRARPFVNEPTHSLVSTLRAYFLTMSAFFFFDGIAHVGIPTLYPVDLVASHMHTFSHAFFFIANAILIRIPISFINQRLKNYASAFILAIGAIAVLWRVLNTDKLVYIFGPTQPPIIVTDKISGILFLISNVVSLLIPGIYLIYLGLKSSERIIMMRAVFLGMGMAVFFSIGPVIDLVQNQYTQLLIHILLALSFFFMGTSAFYTEKETTPKN